MGTGDVTSLVFPEGVSSTSVTWNGNANAESRRDFQELKSSPRREMRLTAAHLILGSRESDLECPSPRRNKSSASGLCITRGWQAIWGPTITHTGIDSTFLYLQAREPLPYTQAHACTCKKYNKILFRPLARFDTSVHTTCKRDGRVESN